MEPTPNISQSRIQEQDTEGSPIKNKVDFKEFNQFDFSQFDKKESKKDIDPELQNNVQPKVFKKYV